MRMQETEIIGLWDEFFTNPEGLAYLNQLGHTHQGYIYRDMGRTPSFSLQVNGEQRTHAKRAGRKAG